MKIEIDVGQAQVIITSTPDPARKSEEVHMFFADHHGSKDYRCSAADADRLASALLYVVGLINKIKAQK